MSIIAKFGNICPICDAHFSCRQELIAQRAAAGDVEELPEARGWADSPNFTKPRRGTRRYANIGRISVQDGRSQDGRFQSKPDPS